MGFLDVFSLAFITFLVAINPINSGIIFLSLSGAYSNKERTIMSFKAFFTSSIVLLVISIFGASIFERMGISISSIRIAGGLLMLKVGIQTIFNEEESAEEKAATDFLQENPTNALERKTIVQKLPDISIFPLAIPIIAGPGAISTSLVMIDSANGVALLEVAVIIALVINLLLTLIFMLSSNIFNKILNKSLTQVLSRIFGLLICSLAVQFIVEGIKTSGLLPTLAM